MGVLETTMSCFLLFSKKPCHKSIHMPRPQQAVVYKATASWLARNIMAPHGAKVKLGQIAFSSF